MDRAAVRSTLLIGLPGIVVVQVLLTLVYPAVSGSQPWYAPDIPMGTIPGLALIHGHLNQVYANREYYNLPLSLPLSGGLQQVALWLHVSPWPGRTVFVDVAYLLVGLIPLYQARQLAWTLGLRRHLLLLQVAAFALIALPLGEWGHGEDVLALAFTLQALRLLMAQSYLPAALCLSAAISSKQWAVMLVPVVVLAAPAGRRLRVLVAAATMPVVLAGLFLAVDFQRVLSALIDPVTQVKGFPGHPWIDGTWLGPHSSSANRAGAVVLAAGAAWYGRRRLADPAALVGLSGLILLIRPLTETINYSYYWTPGLVLVVVAAMAARPDARWRTWVWAVLAELWTLPRSNDVTAPLWWLGEALLLALAVSALVRPRPQPPAPPVGPDRPVLVATAR